MSDIWATPEHRAKIDATIAKRLAQPEALAAMRARLAAVSARRTSESRRTDIMQAWFKHHASDKFTSMEAMHDWIVAQYTSGESARRISQALGMAHNAVVERLRLRGVVPAKRGAGRRNPHTSATYLARKGINNLTEFDRQVAVLYAEGNSVNAIRLAYGLSGDAIRTSLHRSAIPLRGQGNRPSKIPAFRIGRPNSTRARPPVRSQEARGSLVTCFERTHRRPSVPDSSSQGLPRPRSGKMIAKKAPILLYQIERDWVSSAATPKADIDWLLGDVR